MIDCKRRAQQQNKKYKTEMYAFKKKYDHFNSVVAMTMNDILIERRQSVKAPRRIRNEYCEYLPVHEPHKCIHYISYSTRWLLINRITDYATAHTHTQVWMENGEAHAMNDGKHNYQ